MIKHQEQVFVEENLSNLTSNEASVSSSSIRGETSNSNNVYQQQPQYFSHQQQDQNSQQQQLSELPPAKKKRNMPGNPDPESEVIALSPKTLLAKNRFVCEICNKGFQRDQNLQLHRRGHNLPWKLKQRSKTEVIRRKVYVCPEESCVHHDPLRALGDLTGIKKHFCRKHGEKKWKCEKCSKKYAVQSDWKAHSKVCGTREYRCDCGTLFSRRDSFITHRAFCDALAEETARAIPIPTHALLTNTVSAVPSNPNFINMHQHQQLMNTNPLHNTFSLKREQQQNQNYMNLPPWLSCPPIENPPPQQQHHHLTSSSSSSLMFHNQDQQQQVQFQQSSRNPSMGPTYSTTPHLSATALLQQAAQMGALQNQSHVSDNTPTSTAGLFGLHLSSSTTTTTPTTDGPGPGPSPNANPGSSYYHEMMVNSMSTSYDDAFGIGEKDISSLAFQQTLGGSGGGGGGGGGGSGGKGNDGMTRDFLGLRPLSQNEILTMAGLNNCITNNNNNKPRNNLDSYNSGNNNNNNNSDNNSQQEQETPHKSWQT